MPTFVNRTNTPLPFKERQRRGNRYNVRRTKVFIDPFPQIHGTLPEKMVYSALSRYGIEFLFLNDLRFQIPDLEFDKEYQADFVIPSLKLIIEVQGAYFHSKQKTIDADAFKFAIYEIGGYKVLAWWDFDILTKLDQLILSEPLLAGAATNPTTFASRELPVQKRTKVDTSKGIRTLNRKRAERKQYKKITKYKGQGKGITSFTVVS